MNQHSMDAAGAGVTAAPHEPHKSVIIHYTAEVSQLQYFDERTK